MGGAGKVVAWDGHPCDDADTDLFAAATKVTIGNGSKALFWISSWLNGIRPMDIAPKIFDISKKKGCTVGKALIDDHWISQIDMKICITAGHIQEFVTLWVKLDGIILDKGSYTITWKLTESGTYSTASAYMMQFEGHTITPLLKTVWKVWATPKCKFFAWLIIHNRV